MNKALIILTDFYPYRSGENFIDTERDQWDRFDQVYIIPVMAENTDIIRPGFRIKKNETIIRVRNDYTKFSKMISVFSGERGFRCVLKEMRYLYDNHLLRTSTVKEMLWQHALAGLRYRSIRKSIKEIPGDCRILIYSYWLYEPALVAVNIRSQLKEARLISRAHGYDLYLERYREHYIPFREMLLDSADTVYTVSDHGKNYLSSLFNRKYDDKIRVSRLGSLKRNSKDNPESTPGQEPVIVSCSNLIGVKRVHLIIEALKQFPGAITWYHFGDGDLRDEIMTQSSQLPQNVHVYIRGKVDNAEIQQFYANTHIDAFINVSESEGVPVSIMEAQSYGIPVVATDVGGTGEIVKHKVNGYLLRKNFTNDELISAVLSIKEKGEYYRKMAKNGWEENSDGIRLYRAFFDHELTILESGNRS